MFPRRRGCVGVWALSIAVLLTVSSAWGAVTGKITGSVINKKTKEPLIGAAVQVVGTTLGALTDLDGKFLILAVPAGEHRVSASMIGHTEVITSNVVVRPDQTTTLSVELEESLIQLNAIEVVRTADKIEMDQATTKRNVSADKIKSLPVTNVGDILKTQVGVTVRNDRFYIRGGRSDEILYTVDGVSMKDPLGGRGPTESLNLSGTEIENVSIIKGGWDAEYGEATSGIINVATKEGGQKTRGHLEYFTDDFGTESLNTYSFNYDRVEFTLGGPDPFLTKKLLPALGIPTADKLSYFINADFDRTDTYTPYNDYTTPLTRAEFRNFKFLGMVFSDRQKNVGNLGLKLTYRVNPNIRMTGIVKRSYERRMPFSWSYRFTPNTAPWVEDRNDRLSLSMTHTLSPSTFYTVILSRFQRTYQTQPGDPRTNGGVLTPDQFLISEVEADHYRDVNSNGRYDPSEDFIDVYPDGRYNSEDIWVDVDQSGDFTEGVDVLVFDFNGNGRYDASGGEPFADANNNGRWDSGDILEMDGNRNGRYDPERERDMFYSANDIPEPFIDGDRSLGEPFEDINRNGVWDSDYRHPLGGVGEPYQDLSGDSKYQGPDDPWVPGVPYEDLNDNGSYDQGGAIPSGSFSTIDNDFDLDEPFFDRNGDGIRNSGDGFYDRGWSSGVAWHKRDVTTTSININLTSQLRREHEVKVGFKYSAQDLTLGELIQPYIPYTRGDDVGEPFPGRGDLRDFYNQTPKSGSFYVRDKMEYGQMIANLGFRFDYFIQSDNADATITGDLRDDFSGKTEDFRDKFSPRLAFSYPISDKAKVFFNYGHFYQLPQLAFMYRRSTQINSVDGIIGNTELDFQKTIQYEFGIQYLLSSEYVLSIQGFYKDDFGRIGPTQIVGSSSLDTRNFYENRDYSRSRGLEIELDKSYGNYISGTGTYNFSYAFGKASANSLDFFENFYDGSAAVTIKEFPLDWDQRHVVTLILDVRIPPGDHPKLFGLTLPDNMGMNIFWQYGSGWPYTPNADHPGVELLQGNIVPTNSKRQPSHSTVDVRFNKNFRIATLDYTFDLWVNNLFDTKNVEGVFAGTGRPNTSLNSDGIPYLNPKEPSSPRNWSPGRQIRVGLGVNF